MCVTNTKANYQICNCDYITILIILWHSQTYRKAACKLQYTSCKCSDRPESEDVELSVQSGRAAEFKALNLSSDLISYFKIKYSSFSNIIYLLVF